MHRFIIVALAVLTVASCDRFPDNGVQIGGMLPLEADCTVNPSTELRRSRGLWDIALNSEYTVNPLLQGLYISRALDIQAETNNFQVTNLEIVLQTPDNVDLVLPSPLINPYSVTASAVLPATEDGEAALATTSSTGIPASYRDAVSQGTAAFGEVLIAMEAVGSTVGGFTNVSDTFFFPVRICNGCLNICPEGRTTPLTDEERAELAASCRPGQDIYVYCLFPPPEPEEDP